MATEETKTPSAGEAGDFDSALASTLAKAREAEGAPSSEPTDEAPALPPSDASPADSEDASDKGEEPAKKDDEEKKDEPKDEKLAAKYVALAKRSQKVREHESQVKALREQVATKERALVERETLVSQWMQRMEALERDSDAMLTHFAQRGVRFDKLVELASNAKQPEHRIDSLEQKMLEQQRRLEERERQLSEREQKSKRQEVEQSFLRTLNGDEKYEPAQLAYSDDEAIRVADYLADQARAKGLAWSFDDIAEASAELAEKGLTVDREGKLVKSERYSKIKARYQRIGAQPDTNAATGTASTRTNGSGHHATQAKTLTHRHASERAAIPQDDDEDWETRMSRLAERARQEERRAVAKPH